MKIIIMCLGLLTCSHLAKAQTPATLDLSSVEWQRGHVYSMAGAWDFFWQQWLLPHDHIPATHTLTVPGAWHKTASALSGDSAPITPTGYGTYRIKVQLPPKHAGPFYLSMPDMASAYTLWVNGENAGGNGVVARNELEEKPAYLPKVYSLMPDEQGLIELVIHTSNFHYQWGGIWYAPTITDESGLFSIREQPLIKAGIVGSLLMATGLLSLLMFLSRRKDKKVLFFSLLCFAIGLRRLLIDERVLYLFGFGDWSTLQAIENITIYLILPFFLAYFHYLFPKDVPRKLMWTGWAIATPFILAALVSPVAVYTSFNVPFQIACGLIVPLVFWYYTCALRAKRRSSRIFGFSLAIFALAAINDSLNYSYLIDTPNMIHIGALAFVLFQLSAMIRRYFANFKTIETMSAELFARNAELEKLDSFKDEFLATTSHELRTPLHGIYGLAQRLHDNAQNLSSEQRHQVELIEATSQRLTSLVNDILDFSSIKHGKLNLQISKLHLPTLLHTTANTLRPLLHGKHVELSIDVDESLSQIEADAHRIQQVLFNLLGNAIKFTEQGDIRLTAKQVDDFANICIEDSGCGLPDGAQDLLFEPFSQSINANPTQSSGLGLAITRQLLQLHGSELSLGTSQWGGTRACFKLPLVQPHQAAAESLDSDSLTDAAVATLSTSNNDTTPTLIEQARPNQFTVPFGEQARVFYADDEEINRELVRSLLEQAGYRVCTFGSAKDLLKELNRTTPELVLLDLMMPGMSGIEACREIRTRFDHFNLPIMMLTARYQISDIVDALGAGANDYLIKPYHEQELLARLFSQLSVRRLWQASAENARLQGEVNRHAVLERELQCANQQLEQVLDKAEESLILLNSDGVIMHANHAGRAHFFAHQVQLPSSMSDCFTADLQNAFLIQRANAHFIVEDRDLVLDIHRFDQHGEYYYAAHVRAQTEQAEVSTGALLGRLTQELSESRQRIEQIESALRWAKQTTQPEANDSPETLYSQTPCPKELVVKTLRTSLLTWERYTHQSKADLAEKSRCWRVYIDGTTAKTRTLDKYLSVKTLPAKPRWRAVIKTANFVLDNCDLDAQDHAELSELVAAVDLAYS